MKHDRYIFRLIMAVQLTALSAAFTVITSNVRAGAAETDSLPVLSLEAETSELEAATSSPEAATPTPEAATSSPETATSSPGVPTPTSGAASTPASAPFVPVVTPAVSDSGAYVPTATPDATPLPVPSKKPVSTPWPDGLKVKNPGELEYEIVSDTSVTLKWDRCRKVDGYIVYRQNKSGKYVKIKKIKRNAITQFTDDKLTYNKTYSYKVCSYRKVDGVTYINRNDDAETEVILRYKSVYKNGYKLFYDDDGKLITNTEGIIGRQNSYVIKVNTDQCVTTVYAKDGKKGYVIPVRAFICSPGTNTKSGSFHSTSRYRYKVLFYSSYSQWAVRIHGSILFHTSKYNRYMNKTSLDPVEYNKLGTPASHGCIRLQCIGAKWMYDNCRSGTNVIIYKSKNPGPLGKPEYEKLPKWHKWDPTDPTCAELCAEKNCHL